jgi:urease gamma subunit
LTTTNSYERFSACLSCGNFKKKENKKPMNLVPREIDRLMIFTAARVAERRKNDGLLLNYPEAVAYITDWTLEKIRRGATVAQLMRDARHVLTTDDVMPGVAEMLPTLQVEGTFPDGTKLVDIHGPIQPPSKGET